MLIYLWPELSLNAAKLSPASPLSYRAPILALLSAALILADRVSFFNTGATEEVTAKVGLLELDSVNIEVKERSFLCFLPLFISCRYERQLERRPTAGPRSS